MTNDTLMESVISGARAAQVHAAGHCCAQHCGNRDFCFGYAPAGWEGRLSQLAGRLGYSFHRDWLPVMASGEGCNGFTTGSFRDLPFEARLECRNLGITEYSIHYRPEPNNAQEFAVAVHECAHAVLGHPHWKDKGDVSREFEGEIPVRLATQAVCAAAGLRNTSMHTCQMTQRMKRFGRDITLEHQNAGLIAARVITEALSPAQMRRAA